MAFLDIVDTERFLATFQESLHRDMLAAAEPIIQKSMIDIERELRKSLAAFVVTELKTSFSLERYGHDLRITVLDKTNGTNS